MQCAHHGSRLSQLLAPSTPTQVPLSTLGGHQSQRASGDTATARAGSALMGGSSRVMDSPLLFNIVHGFDSIRSELVPQLAFSLYSGCDLDVTSAVTGLVQ